MLPLPDLRIEDLIALALAAVAIYVAIRLWRRRG
jgi:hypothetical protein